MKKGIKIAVPADLSYGDVIYLMSGQEEIEGTGIYTTDVTPLFVKGVMEPEDKPGSLLVTASIGSDNGERREFKFSQIDHHIPKKLKLGQIFLDHDEALENWKALAKENYDKVMTMVEPLQSLNQLVQETTSIIPLPEFKAKRITISQVDNKKKSTNNSSSITMEVKTDDDEIADV